MVTRPKFGTDGVRGTYGKDIDEEFAFVLGVAIARTMGTDCEYIIGRDTRVSGQVLSNALIEGLKSAGATTQDLGILPTPGIAMIAKRDSKRACVITASHNPAHDNGIKVFDVGGVKISSAIEVQLEAQIETVFTQGVQHKKNETETALETIASQEYVSYLVDVIGSRALEGLKVVLDCANGASYKIAPSAFLLCGARVNAINTESDGIRINQDCGATHLTDLIREVRQTRADVGFAFDGDADRVIAVDENGVIRDGDYILALFAKDMKASGNLIEDTVVATSMSNGGLKIFCDENSMEFIETQVGDKYVLEVLVNKDYSLGGEQSGHIIRRDFANWGDGTLNALLIARILNESKINDSQYRASKGFDLFKPMIQKHAKVEAKNKDLANGNERIEQAVEKELISLGADSRVIVRPSGTEAVVRITVEGKLESEVENSIVRLEKIVESVCS